MPPPDVTTGPVSSPAPGVTVAVPAGLQRAARRVAAAIVDTGRDVDQRARFRKGKVTGWVAYSAGPPEQPAAVTVDVFGTAKIPVLGGLRLSVNDGVWLASTGGGGWVVVGRLDVAAASPAWPVAPQMKSGATYAGAPSAVQSNVDSAWDIRDGWVDAECAMRVTSWNGGGSTLWINLPVAPRAYASGQLSYNRPIGTVVAIQDPTGGQRPGHVLYEATGGGAYIVNPSGGSWTITSPLTWLSTVGEFHFRFRYRAA